MSQQQSSSSYSSIPKYVQDTSKSALSSVQNALNSQSNYVYGSQEGESLYTPLSDNQNKAIGNISWLADQDLADMFGINDANSLWDQYTNAGAHTIDGTYHNAQGQDIQGGGVAGQIDGSQYGLGSNSTQGERVVDENGYLGSINDYMDPYLQQVLNPQIRELDESLQKGIRAQDANAQMSGSFGDARHGIVDSQLYDDRARQGSDITGKAYSDAYNNAMSLRSGDINREGALQENAINRALGIDTANIGFNENAINRDLQAALARAGFADNDANRDLDVAKTNQQAEESATDRLGVGASAKSSLGKQYYDYFTGVNDALYNAGTVERDAAEDKRSATQQFQEALKNKKYDDALKLLAAASGSTYPTGSSSSSTTSSNDGAAGIAGSVLGGLFG